MGILSKYQIFSSVIVIIFGLGLISNPIIILLLGIGTVILTFGTLRFSYRVFKEPISSPLLKNLFVEKGWILFFPLLILNAFIGILIININYEVYFSRNIIFFRIFIRGLYYNMAVFSLIIVGLFILIFIFRWFFEKGILGSITQNTISVIESSEIISGMLKVNNSVSIKDLAELGQGDESFWKRRFYQLIGNDSLDGEFDGTVFTLAVDADIGAAIDSLFADFEEFESKKIGKI